MLIVKASWRPIGWLQDVDDEDDELILRVIFGVGIWVLYLGFKDWVLALYDAWGKMGFEL